MMAINSDGSVVVCCVDWSRKTLCGNVRNSSLLDIWNGEAINNIRKIHLRGERYNIDSCRFCKRMPLDLRDRMDDNALEILNRLTVHG